MTALEHRHAPLQNQREVTPIGDELFEASSVFLESDEIQSIEHHLDRRIQFFFQQIIILYKIPFIFEEGKTERNSERELKV